MANKYELLMSYSTANQRDTWMSLGSMTVSNLTRVYSVGTIFRLNEAGTPLDGSIFYSNADFTTSNTFDWNNYIEVTGGTNGEIIDSSTSIIHANIQLVMTNADYLAIVPAYDSSFIPFQEEGAGANLDISDNELNQILGELGVPFISIDELEFNRDQIINNMIWPAIIEFYKYFPILSITKEPLANSTFSVNFPSDPNIFTAVNAVVVPGYPITNTQGNPILRYFDEVLLAIAPATGYGTPNANSSRRRQQSATATDYGTYLMERAVRQGIMNVGTRRRVSIRTVGRTVTGYTTTRGVLEITWGAFSRSWSDIPVTRLSEVRDLAKAHVLRTFGSLRLQAKSDIPGTIDYSNFITRADALETKIKTFWESTTQAPLIRN